MAETPAPRPKSATALIEVLANDLTYIPNPEQRKVKESFWVRFTENPVCEPTHITLSIVLQLVGDPRLDRWWNHPGFKEWFRNQEEFRERAATMAHLALDTLQSILLNELAQPSARVNAAKLVLEISQKMPQKQAEIRYRDDSIGKMSKSQLEAFLTKNVHLLPTPPPPGLTDLTPGDTVDSNPRSVESD